eukprot:31510-Pelagococcus_subviridis.AAC.16
MTSEAIRLIVARDATRDRNFEFLINPKISSTRLSRVLMQISVAKSRGIASSIPAASFADMLFMYRTHAAIRFGCECPCPSSPSARSASMIARTWSGSNPSKAAAHDRTSRSLSTSAVISDVRWFTQQMPRSRSGLTCFSTYPGAPFRIANFSGRVSSNFPSVAFNDATITESAAPTRVDGLYDS